MGKRSCIFYVSEKFVGYFALIWAYATFEQNVSCSGAIVTDDGEISFC